MVARNPCPCGYYPDRNKCNCSEMMIQRYQNGISKPILERIDICAESSSIKFEEMTSNIKNETSKTKCMNVLMSLQLLNYCECTRVNYYRAVG